MSNDGKPRATKQNLETIEEFKAVMRKFASQGMHVSVDSVDSEVQFWKRNAIHPGRAHGIGIKPWRTRAVSY